MSSGTSWVAVEGVDIGSVVGTAAESPGKAAQRTRLLVAGTENAVSTPVATQRTSRPSGRSAHSEARGSRRPAWNGEHAERVAARRIVVVGFLSRIRSRSEPASDPQERAAVGRGDTGFVPRRRMLAKRKRRTGLASVRWFFRRTKGERRERGRGEKKGSRVTETCEAGGG